MWIRRQSLTKVIYIGKLKINNRKMSKIERGKEKEKAEKLMTNVDFALDLMLGIERLAKDLTNKYNDIFPEDPIEKAKIFCYCLIEGALANISSDAKSLARNLK